LRIDLLSVFDRVRSTPILFFLPPGTVLHHAGCLCPWACFLIDSVFLGDTIMRLVAKTKTKSQ
jgi:hypothetical protein